MRRNVCFLIFLFLLFNLMFVGMVQAGDFTCKIYATEGWQSCGFAHKGDIVKVKAYGSWRFSNWRPPVGPEGTQYVYGDNLLDNCPHAALIYTMDRKYGWCYSKESDREFIATEDGPIFLLSTMVVIKVIMEEQ